MADNDQKQGDLGDHALGPDLDGVAGQGAVPVEARRAAAHRHAEAEGGDAGDAQPGAGQKGLVEFGKVLERLASERGLDRLQSNL